ncbi:hypothetical protein LTR36_005975 [Oleoguttula mirabilis]|uniref:F-box domain-containing protein n=1 Tax=Oleoguttula mirabilis TaxID=1507867 RepID=A0AAV9JCU4_9PEZI|nr:hypothetical protein LTR36_005975 [Oleoguttula mirabilis]
MQAPTAGLDASFDALPVEIIEHVLADVALCDIRSLRLAVDLRPHALQGLSEQLEAPDSIACNLENLTITGVLYITKSQEKILRLQTFPSDSTDVFGQRHDGLGNWTALQPKRKPAVANDLAQAEHELEVLKRWQGEVALERSTGSDLQSLMALFERIGKYGASGGLRSLKLNVVVVRFVGTRVAPKDGGAWRPIWDYAAHLFAVTLHALARTSLRVERFDVYSEVEVCSVPGFDIASTLEHQASEPHASDVPLRNVLRSLKALSLSTSSRVVAPIGSAKRHEADPDDEVLERPVLHRRQSIYTFSESDTHDLEAMIADPRSITSVAQLLHHTPDLEELDLHSYRLPWYDAQNFSLPEHTQAVFGCIVRIACLPLLKKLTLRGLSPRAEDLLSFLHASPGLQSSISAA